MTGMTEYDPDGYDIRFEHVTFAYREKEDAEDVSLRRGRDGAGRPLRRQIHGSQIGGPSGTRRRERWLGGVDVSTVDGGHC